MTSRKHDAQRRKRRTIDSRTLGGIVITMLVATIVLVDSGFVSSLLAPGGNTVRARFLNTAQLKKGDPVRVDGVKIGRVDALALDPGGRSATVEMTIFDEGQPVYKDASAILRWRTVLGGNFAVDLDRGQVASGEIGKAVIPTSRTANQVEIDDLISFARQDARRGLQQVLDTMPRALAQRDGFAGALRPLKTVAPPLATALSAVRGENEADLRPLVKAAGRTVSALDAPTEPIRQLVEGGAITMSATANRRVELGQSIELAAAIQGRVRDTLVQLRGTLDAADPLLARLQQPATQIAPAVNALKPLLVGTDRLLADAQPLLRTLRPAVQSLARTGREGTPLVNELAPSVKRAAKTILPELAERDAVTKLRTYEIAGPVIAALNAAASNFDIEGHLFRFPALGGERALSDDLPCTTYFTDPESPSLVECDSLNDALDTYFGFVPSVLGSRKGSK